MGEKSRREYQRRGSGEDTHRGIVTDDEGRGEAALAEDGSGPQVVRPGAPNVVTEFPDGVFERRETLRR